MAREMEPDDPRYIPDDLKDIMSMERSVFDPDMTEEQQSRDIFRKAAPVAAATIVKMAQMGSTERVRFDAAKYITERVLGTIGQDNGVRDPLEEFLKSFTGEAERVANGEK